MVLPSDLSHLSSASFSYFTKYHGEAQSFTELLNCFIVKLLNCSELREES
jgi:hypothetical protein